jgi:hypothetical protein
MHTMPGGMPFFPQLSPVPSKNRTRYGKVYVKKACHSNQGPNAETLQKHPGSCLSEAQRNVNMRGLQVRRGRGRRPGSSASG